MQRRLIPLFFSLLALLVLAPAVPAADTPQMTAKVDRDSLALGSFLNLYIIMRDVDGDVDLSPLESTPDFKILGRNSSTNISFINFEKHVEKTLLLRLAPQKAGRLEIPALGLDSGAKQPRTRPISISVAAVDTRPPGRAPSATDDVFLEAAVSNSSPYVGEPLLYTLKIHLGLQINNPRLSRPDIEGFVSTELEEQPRYDKDIGGRRYVVVEVRRLLTPLTSGELIVPPSTLQCEVLRRSNSFFPEMRPVTAQSDPVNVQVRPLPEYAPKPGEPAFSGLIGAFEVSSSLDKDTLAAGESATLTVTVSGRGNLPDVSAPELQGPESFKIYQDSPTEDLQAGPEGYIGEKRFGYALVPLKPGEFSMPAVRLAYFSPEEGAYRIASSEVLTLNVTPGEQSTAAAPESASGQSSQNGEQALQPTPQEEVEFLHKDILPLKEGLEGIEDAAPLPLMLFWLLLLAPALCFGLALLVAQLRRGEKPQHLLQAQLAKKLLDEAHKQTDPAAAVGLCSRALVAGVNARCASAGASLTYSEARERLACTGLAPETAKQAAALLERLDGLRYGGAPSAQARLMAIEETTTMLRRLL